WPAWKMDTAHPQMLICILGSDSIGPIAERYAQNQRVAGKPLQVRHINSVEAAASCNLLYVGVGEQKHVDPVVDELARRGVLTVSEITNATTPNQVIGLPTLNEQVHIDINLRAAQRTGLTISSKLLHLATVSR
ncbi:MAG TPA: YfiR family protein, partial [Acidobacteriaceae bacterium]